MAVRWSDIADSLESRGRRLSMPDDVGDMILAAYGVLQQLVDTYDLPAYTLQNDAMFATRAGERRYLVPDDFGRLLHPRDELSQGVSGTGQSGLFLSDGTNRPFPLRYEEPTRFRQNQTPDRKRSTTFTVAGRDLVLDPPPDDGLGSGYIGQGAYIARVERPDLDLEGLILLDEPSFLVSATLYQMAADRGLPQAAVLEKEHLRQMSALVNNSHRLRQRFFTNRWPLRSYR